MSSALESWLERQYAHSREQMLRSISRTDLVKERPGFGQSVRAARGSVIASPVLADWDPEPDYFFHWFRDSALVIDALRVLHEDGQLADAPVMLADFVAFSSALQRLDGRALARDPSWREPVAAAFRQYLRDDEELAAVRGEDVVGQTRVNPDATLDISRWTRPQHDGAALRALALLRWHRHVVQDAPLRLSLERLVEQDLAFVLTRWQQSAFDMWEEEQGLHYHTLCVAAAALEAGAAVPGVAAAGAWQLGAHRIRTRLDEFWLVDEGIYASRLVASGDPAKRLDIAVVFAAIHAWNGSQGAHTASDPRVHATLDALVALFAREYAINRDGRAGPAMGRYRGDHYFSGGAYYFSTLGAAELCFRAALGASGADAARWRQRGDAFLETVMAFTPPNGDLSEQFDQNTGVQSSARHLAWSYAAFITCLAARRAARAVASA